MSLKRTLIVTLASLGVVGAVAWCCDYFFGAGSSAKPGAFLSNPSAADRGVEAPSTDVLARVSSGLTQLFPDENDWRRVSANVVVPSNRECFFLFKNEPQISPDRTQLTLDACTIIFLASGDDLSEEERCRRALVFETSDRVALTFSKPIANFTSFESASFDFSAFEKGEMLGTVELRSQSASPTPDDDVFLQTRDVVFTAKQIRTNFDVSFRFGRNYGAGKGLTIDLDAPLRFDRRELNASDSSSGDELQTRLDKFRSDGNLGGGFSLEQVELNELNGYFRFYLDNSTNLTPDVASGRPENSAYVDIRCKKGAYFSSNPEELGGWCVKFESDVEVVSYRDGEKAEQLLCDTLYLYLRDPDFEALVARFPELKSLETRNAPTGTLARLEPTTIRALRSPTEQAVVKLSANDFELSADEFVYDVRLRRLGMSAESREEPVRLVDGEKGELEFTANAVQIQFDENNELETVLAGKDGMLETVFRDESGVGRRFQALWKEGLRVAPEPDRRDVLKLSTIGGVKFILDGIGSFTAQEADFWGKLTGASNGAPVSSDDAQTVRVAKPNLQSESESVSNADVSADPSAELASRFSQIVPIGAAFRGGVAFEAPRGTANISDSVAVRFASAPPPTTSVESAQASDAASVDGADRKGAFFTKGGMFDEESETKFEIQGENLDLWCVLTGASSSERIGSVDALRLTIRGGVSLVERSKVDGSETTRVVADEALLEEPSSPRARLRLIGSSATFRRKELELVGYDIVVDRAKNEFCVVGPGKLRLAPIASDKLQENAAAAQFLSDDPVEIQWSKAMTFDGKTLRFEAAPGQNVLVAQRTQTLSCPEARFTLSKPVSIFELDVGGESGFDRENLDVETVECLGDFERPVRIDAVAFGQNDATSERNGDAAFYQAVFQNLTFRRATGEFVATGGGSVRSTTKASSNASASFANPLGTGDGNAPTRPVSRSTISAETTAPTEPRWTRVHLKFFDQTTGRLDRREIFAQGGIQAVVCQTVDPNLPLDVARVDDFPKDAVYLTGDEAFVKFFGGEKEGKPRSLEVDARRNVTFRRDDVIGLCDGLKYASEKETAILTGDGANKATLYRQAFAGDERVVLGEFMRAIYRLKTQSLEIEDFSASAD